jgi:hypothetical protein
MSTSGIVRIKKPLHKSGRRKAEKVLTFLTQSDIRRDCQNKYPSFINRERIPHVVIKPSHHQLRRSRNLNTTTSLLLNYNLRDKQSQIKNRLPIITCFAIKSYGLRGVKIFSYTGIETRPYSAGKSQNLSRASLFTSPIQFSSRKPRQASFSTACRTSRAIGICCGQRCSASR